MSFEKILPFLRPIEHLILDPDISEVMVNASSRVFIERQGEMEEVFGVALDERYLRVAIQNIARRLGDDFSEEKPLLDSRLPDGSRVAAVMPPCSVDGIVLTIRKFHKRWFGLSELTRSGFIPEDVCTLLQDAVASRENILISGGPGTGKTTFLNALTSCIPPSERLVVIEDTAEVQLGHRNIVRLEARPELPSLPAVTIRELVKKSLRHRPDRIIVGEVRGEEAFDLLQALNTGHSGSLSTIHANSAAQALSRFVNCVLQSGIDLPYQALCGNIGESLNLIVQIERRGGKRYVCELVRLTHFDHERGRFQLERLYDVHAGTRQVEIDEKKQAENTQIRIPPARASRSSERRLTGGL